MAAASQKSPKAQIDKFRELARELGADDSEAAFEAKVKKITKAKTQKERPA